MSYEPVTGRPLRFPPGRVEVRLNAGHQRAYRRLYARYGAAAAGLPVLRPERDFDGRPVRMTAAQLEAMNRSFAALAAEDARQPGGTFDAQEAARTKLFKRLQYLS